MKFSPALLLAIGLAAIPVILAADCVAATPNGPVQVNADCIDVLYTTPVITSETDLPMPSPHRLVSGHFNGTQVKFNIYLPPLGKFGSRFFQFVYPTQTEDADATVPETVAFGLESRAYTVHVSGTLGYRADAATAKFSKVVAAKYYKQSSSRRIYGYIYGGSGGSLMTVGAAENTDGVWDGAVPIVQAVPVSLINNLAGRALASLVLRNKSASIVDAIRPGGGDLYADLNQVQRVALLEATKFGISLKAWEDFSAVADTNTLQLLSGIVQSQDSTYENDFWTKDGYLGTEVSELGNLIRAAKIEQFINIRNVIRDAQNKTIGLQLDSIPVDPSLPGLQFKLYDSNGTSVSTLTGTLNRTTSIFTLGSSNAVADATNTGTTLRLRVDNRWFIALHAYQRYQVPKRPGFYGFDQYRNSSGNPIYPQRATLIADSLARATSGRGTQTGAIRMPMIVVSNLLDVDAYPWHADWYKSQVRAALGSTEKFDDNYRIWYNENAIHYFEPVPENRQSHIVPYTGIYHQALRDLSAWVEHGKPPPQSTKYSVKDSQIVVAPTANQRHGVQAVVKLIAQNSKNPVRVKAGQKVKFEVQASVPPNAGTILSIVWDFYGTGAFTAISGNLTTKTSAIYPTTGTFFAGVKVTTKRDVKSKFGDVLNLDRVRVVVV